jgi:hypothetical protein
LSDQQRWLVGSQQKMPLAPKHPSQLTLEIRALRFHSKHTNKQTNKQTLTSS